VSWPLVVNCVERKEGTRAAGRDQTEGEPAKREQNASRCSIVRCGVRAAVPKGGEGGRLTGFHELKEPTGERSCRGL